MEFEIFAFGICFLRIFVWLLFLKERRGLMKSWLSSKFEHSYILLHLHAEDTGMSYYAQTLKLSIKWFFKLFFKHVYVGMPMCVGSWTAFMCWFSFLPPFGFPYRMWIPGIDLSADSFYLINPLTESESSLSCHNNMIHVHHLSVKSRIENFHLDMEVEKPLNHMRVFSWEATLNSFCVLLSL